MSFFAKILGKKYKPTQIEEQPQAESGENSTQPAPEVDAEDQTQTGAESKTTTDPATSTLSPTLSSTESGNVSEEISDMPIQEQSTANSPRTPETYVEQKEKGKEQPATDEKQNAVSTSVHTPQLNKNECAYREEFILKLREVAPTPGNWLKVVLDGCDVVDDTFWKRLRLLFESLQLPNNRGDDFITELQQWIADMQFTKIDEFSSELQYRLALTLGMENDAEEKKRFWAKLWNGLARTRELISGSLRSIFSGNGELDTTFWENLEEALLLSDVGYESSMELVERVRTAAKKNGAQTPAQAKELLQRELEQALTFPPTVHTANQPEIVLMVGVNGAGKTTTIAKLAYRERLAGKKVLIAAGDTFRAAAVEQLEVWAKRVGADFYSKPSNGNNPADPAAVAYEAVGKAIAENYDIMFFDTAGRLQTKTGLMEELGKIVRVLGKRHNGAPQRTVLVLDATTGQNALSQAKLFSETSPVSEIIISKLDGTAKGGVAVGIAMQQKIPITFIGLGEKMEDLRPFDGQTFAKALLD